MHFIVLLYLWNADHDRIRRVGSVCFTEVSSAQMYADEWVDRAKKISQSRDAYVMNLDQNPYLHDECLDCDQQPEMP